MKIKIHPPNNPDLCKHEVLLPLSKSISNRALMISAISKGKVKTGALSDADDTILLQNLLQQIKEGKNTSLNVRNAGTVMRFLTAYLSQTRGSWILEGSDRMHERQISQLVKALNTLGADIRYLGRNGFPPIQINGKHLRGGHVSIKSNISSQFVSAMMLMGPCYQDRIGIKLINNPVSLSYIFMTQKMMIKAGAKISIDTEDANNIHISVDNKPYEECQLEAEVDWSSAAFWYQIVSLSKIRNLILKGLNKDSIQGDIKLIEFFKQLGVSTSFTNKGVLIGYTGDIRREPKFDFTNYPDLALPVVITAAAHGVRGIFTGLSNLQHKESNRLKVLEETVSILSGIRTISNCGKLVLPKRAIGERLTIKANDDHRVIMALTPLSLLGIDIKLDKENMKEVNKSYPNFWNELGRVFHLH